MLDHSEALILISLGLFLLLGLLTYLLGQRTPLPRVTLLLVFGFLAGPGALDLLPRSTLDWFPLVTKLALVMVGFLLGGQLTLTTMRQYGRLVLWISISVVLCTTVATALGLMLTGAGLQTALLLGAIAAATDPAATSDVVHEAGARGEFTGTLLGVVAVDDAWGLIVFSLVLSGLQILGGQADGGQALLSGAWDLGGAVLLGVVLGVPMAFLTGRIRPGEPTLAEALGAVFLCGGLALWLEVSFLLAPMVMGLVVANLARHHTRPFHAIENVEWPFLIVFFMLSGASLHPQALPRIGLVGTAYVLLRVIGRLLGSLAGGALSRARPSLRRWMGLALLPQAGVALGLALVAGQRFPNLGSLILPVVVGATVLFELLGPVLTKQALLRVGEASGRPGPPSASEGPAGPQ